MFKRPKDSIFPLEFCDFKKISKRKIVETNSGTWILILALTYSTKIFIGETAQQHTSFPLSSVCYFPEIRLSVSQYLVQYRYRQVSLLVT